MKIISDGNYLVTCSEQHAATQEMRDPETSKESDLFISHPTPQIRIAILERSKPVNRVEEGVSAPSLEVVHSSARE